MRKFTILGLGAVLLLVSASDVFAQRGGVSFGGRGGGGISIGTGSGGYGGISIGAGSGYYGNPYSGNRYYGGSGYYGGNYGGPNYGGRYYSSPGYYATPGYSYSYPDYYYSDAVPLTPAPEVRQSFYTDPNSATITVVVPNSDAQVWFDDNLTTQRGMERLFYTPSLQGGGTYTIKARWIENGRTMDQQRQVQVQPGQSITVNFQASPAEQVQCRKSR